MKGYQNPEKIYESSNSLVYCAFDEKNKRPIILKVLKKKAPTPEEISNFNREYELTRMLTGGGVIEVYEISKIDTSPAIIMEDIGGRSLADILKSIKLPPDKFLDLAVRITGIIGNIHQHNIIHKDINPSNIIWNAEKDILRIIDFGIATQLPREITSVKNPNVLVGTIAYISPEQTGRMNRSLDYRTDFYSLGISFYWMLTGRLPFESRDLLKLVHSHIAVLPTPPHGIDENIPEPISKIVMKLMAKNAEDRYLSAHGLKADLERCRQELRNTGSIPPFEPGKHDVSDKFQIPQKLYGREQEIRTLMSAFERVSEANTELMLVSGFSGIGKSVLINEIQKPIVKQSGYFISGKFERLKKDVPYSAIIQAFTGLARQILAEGDAKINRWKEKILSVLGPNGKIVTDIIPLFELIIGTQPDAPALGPVESQNRFNLVFQEFIKILAGKEHPLVIFLDDLQWADLASLHLLKLFTSDSDIQHLFIIGAFRHNETPDSHPLVLTLNEIKKSGAVVNHIFLRPLDVEQVSELLGDTLNRITGEMKSPAELLIRKTGGNPFFINEFLKSLYKKNLIEFSFEDGWSWDMARIENMQVTGNVVALMAAKIADLPENSQEVLKLGACIGSNFNLIIMKTICGKPEEDILPALKVVIQEGMLNIIDTMYRFSHDRVQEAAYSLIPDDEKTRLHYRIGNLELRNTEKEELPENIFYIVNQLNAGVDLVTEKSEKFNLAKLNLMAGKKALASNAYASALNYLKAGIDLLSKNSWQEDYDFTLELYREAAVAAQLTADYATMEKMAEEVFQHAVSIPDAIKVYETKIFACMAQNQLLEGIRIGLGVLKKLGVSIPEKPGKLRVVYELLLVKLSLRGNPVENLINRPEMKNPYKLAAMQMLTGIGTSAYYAAPELLPLVIFNTVKISVKYGNSIYSPYSYAAFGMIYCSILGDINTGYEWGKLALDLVEKLNTRKTKSRVWMVTWFFINHWKRPMRDSIKPLLEAYRIGLEIGDLEFAALSASTYTDYLLNCGVQLTEVEKEITKYTGMIKKINQDTTLNYHLMRHQTVLNLLGKSDDPRKLIGSSYNDDENKITFENKQATDVTALIFRYYYLLNLNYLFENYEEALKHAEFVKPYIDAEISSPYIPLFYFYNSLIRLALYPASKKSVQKNYLKKVKKNQVKMKKWASHAPMNYSHKYHLVEAEIARVRGENRKAGKHYDLAVKLARENKFLREEALALELTAKFRLGLNEEKIAALYMTEANHAYRAWGAIAKVKQIEEKYRYLLAIHAGEIDTEGR
ncbi:MAG: serine/threonine-protein kinase PknK [bacterium]|nr:serine/threonine-protein kinase PknK [bacterium]